MNNIVECAESELDLLSVPHNQTSVLKLLRKFLDYPHPNFKNATQILFDNAG